MSASGSSKHEQYARSYVTAGIQGQAYPREYLVRLLLGSYIPDLDRDFEGKKFLDIGCGNGMNLTLAGRLGMKLYGVEVHPEILDVAKEVLAAHGLEADLRVGENTSLPFPDGFFDVLVSWDVLHYSNTRALIEKSLAEYARIMKPGARLLLRTVGPTHWLPDHAVIVDDETLEYRRGDHRDGWRVYRFASEQALVSKLDPWFDRIRIGRVQEDLFIEHWDLYIATAVRR